MNAITRYQRYISPHKGFRCAHRVLHGGESCSQYVKRQVAENGLKMAFFQARKRFEECKQANQTLREMRFLRQHQLAMETPEIPEEMEVPETEENLPVPIEKPAKSSRFNERDCTTCADLGCSSLEILDCSALDCAAIDTSSLDCGGLDCGGCSF
nr:membrane protein insertion efficiency factor YidD [Anabaena sp. FACHB-1237]